MLLAKKYNNNAESLLSHLLKNKWAAESLLINENITKKTSQIDNKNLILKAVELSCVYHDLGKANEAFQRKLISGKKNELLPHECISFMFLFELFQKTKDEVFFLASLSALKHHNRSLRIDFSSGRVNPKELISDLLAVPKLYKDKKKTNRAKIDDSDWIKRSHVEGSDEVIPLNIDREVIDIYANLGYDNYNNELSSFINKINGQRKEESVQLFLLYIKKASCHLTEDLYCNFLLAKSLMKLCDEFASKEDSKNNEADFKKEFSLFITSAFFFEGNKTSKLYEKIGSGELKPNELQLEIIESEVQDCVLINSSPGSGKTLATELIKMKKDKNFISYHLPSRFLAKEQANRFETIDDLVPHSKLKYITEMWYYHHTIDQLYQALTGQKREFFLLKLIFGGIVVLDEIDVFQEEGSFPKISFILKTLSLFKVPVVVTTATSTKCIEDLIKESYGFLDVFPKKVIKNKITRGNFCFYSRKGAINKKTDDIIKKIKESQDLGLRVGVFLNTINSAVFLMDKLSKKGINAVLYHSRLDQEERIKREDLLKETFSKQNKKTNENYPIAIMTPVAEVGVDISFDLIISEPAPIRNIEQRIGRLNRWNEASDCSFMVLDFYLTGFGSKKNKHFILKQKNREDLCTSDPFFGDDLCVLNQHLSIYRSLDNKTLGYENTFVCDKTRKKLSDYKNLWLEGVFVGERRKILTPQTHVVSLTRNVSLYRYSISVLPFFCSQADFPDFINSYFRKVNAKEFIDDDGLFYKSVPIHFFNGDKLSDKYISDKDYGIAKANLFT